jgi:hypothetical protein
VNEERLGSPAQFAAALARNLAAYAHDGLPRPSDADLALLVEVMFFASLHEEEGRRTAFSIAWQPGSGDCAAVLAMAAPVPVTPQNLAKLAPATHRDATSIAVRREAHGLAAWALMQRSAASEAPLTIWSLAPGVVRVDYAGIPRALFARGQFLFLDGLHEVKSPARALTTAFSQWQAEADPETGIALRAAIVTRIASRTLEHGHGGMILITRSDVSLPAGVRVHYAVSEGRNVLAKRYAEVTRDVPIEEHLQRLRGSRERGLDGRVYVRDEAQIAFSEAIDFVARLTSVDNALLLDTDLNVRGFGVQVIESDAPQMQFSHVSPYTQDVHVDDLSTFKGTRHPAGVIFCMRQEQEAAAIIASQDRRLSLAIKDARGVVAVLGSYERAFGWR